MTYRVGLDVGGTFTDFALQDEATGELSIYKELTTPEDASVGIMRGLTKLLQQKNISLRDVLHAIHGTTLAANTVIERSGVKTGLITTRGFRDVLLLGREKRYELYDLFIQKPVSLVPRYLIKEVTERLSYSGEVITPPDGAEIRKVVRELLRLGVRSIAVCLLHSYANPNHERLVGSIIQEEAPDIPVSLSTDVSPLYREYERTQTTVVNAYVAVQVRDYLRNLQDNLKSEGFEGNFYIMQSAGGIATAETMERYPVRMIESGPAAGALIAAFYGRLGGHRDLISFDMGGTTAKVCLIEQGRPSVTDEFEIDRVQLKTGSGLTLNVPAIDLVEIGAGGGSIAKIEHGLIGVGPESAGANPGPLCYGLGGLEPTVTDADLVLGYLNPDYFLGGEMKLDKELAMRGIEEKIADPLGLSITDAAWGIHEIVTTNMARATRMVSVERGRDPRLLTLVAFGGAGPIHGPRIAQDLQMAQTLVPAGAGVTSALGLLSAEVRFDLARTQVLPLNRESLVKASKLYEEMEAAGKEMLASSKVQGKPVLVREVDMRYVGQGHEVTVPLSPEALSTGDIPALEKAFNEIYATRYGYSDPGEPIEAVTWKLTAYSEAAEFNLKRLDAKEGRAEEALKGHRLAYFPEYRDFTKCPVYDRYRLLPGASIRGPAIVEERECTVVILPNHETQVDPYGSLIIRKQG